MDKGHTWDFDIKEVIPCPASGTQAAQEEGYGNTGAQPENRSYEKGEKEC